MGNRLETAHPIHGLTGVAATLGALSAGLGARTHAGIDLARIRGILPGHAWTAVPEAALVQRSSDADGLRHADLALPSRASQPWTL